MPSRARARTRLSRAAFAAASWTLALHAATPVVAQSPAELRFELGQKLRRVERAWSSPDPDPATRERTAIAVGRSVGSFFRLDITGAARALDLAWLTLAGREQDVASRLAAALRIRPVRRLMATEATLEVRVGPLYPLLDDDREPVDPPDGTEIVVTWNGDRRTATWTGDEISLTFDAADAVAAGAVEAVARWPGGSLALPPVRVAAVPELAARLEILSATSSGTDDDPPDLEAASLAGLVATLRTLADGGATESDFPPEQLLAQAERFAAAITSGESPRLDEPGQLLLRVPVGSREIPVRIAVPAPREGGAPPLVLALHGAGGSENLFFEGYGDGGAVRLAVERGWYAVAPRNLRPADAGSLLDALAERFAFDPERVYAVGHSMGAATAVAAAQACPGRLAKLALLGGGGRVADRAALRELPCLVGVGTSDFALGGARALARALESAGAETTLREYAGIEHLLVVQVALSDVFAFFDQ